MCGIMLQFNSPHYSCNVYHFFKDILILINTYNHLLHFFLQPKIVNLVVQLLRELQPIYRQFSTKQRAHILTNHN